MSYTINKTDGTLLTTIPDGSYDSSVSSLFLPGPNFLGYGLHLNENLVSLLENFAANTAPSGSNLPGQLWYNKSAQTLNVYTGPAQGYMNVTGLTISGLQPQNPVAGNTWLNSTTNQLYMFDGTTWSLIGPTFTKTQGVSGAIPVAIGDQNVVGITHHILQLQYGNVVLATISPDSTFTPSPAIPGFSVINPGITINSGINYFSYGNTQVGQYLPDDPTIVSIRAGATATNAAIVTANSAVVSYVNTLNSAMADAVVLANTNVVSYVNTQISVTNANVAAANTAIQNVTTAWTANAVIQDSAISGLRANITAANAAIVTANAGAVSYVNTLNSAMIANITAANAFLAQTAIIAGAYGNANVGAYIPTDDTIQTIQTRIVSTNANVTAANAAIVGANLAVVAYVNTLNSAMVTYVNSLNTAAVANAVIQDSAISGLRANITAANSAISTTNTALTTANSAVVSYVNTLNSAMTANVTAANAAIVAANAAAVSYVNTLNSAMTANVTATNAAIVTANTGMLNYVNSLVTSVSSGINANVTAANSAIVTANNAVVSYVNVTNSSLLTYINGLNSAMTANITAANAAIATNSYSNVKVGQFLPVYSGTLSAQTVVVGGGLQLARYSRTQLLGNIVGNITATVVYNTTSNSPVYFNGTNWCFFSNNASI